MPFDWEPLKDKYDLQWYADEGFGDIFSLQPLSSDKLIINVALTGMIPRKSDTPYVPIGPEETVADVVRCHQAGASVVHLHARDSQGNPVFAADDYRETVTEIRRQCPEVIINLTTSGRDVNTFESRSQVLELNGLARPDMASLTMGSLNFPKTASVNSPKMIVSLATRMYEQGITPELEIFETGMINYARYLKHKGVLRSPMYFNLLLGSLGAMPARLSDLDHLIGTLPPGCVWGAAGIGRFQLPMNLAGILKGGHVRVGLEDNIYYDCHKQQLAQNSQLVERLVDFARLAGREVATAKEARAMIGLPSRPDGLTMREIEPEKVLESA